MYNAREAIGTPVGIIGVKEKFGGLRIYTEYLNEELEEIIIEVGKESFTICEECGKPGSLRKKNEVYFTACDFDAGEAERISNPV